MKTTPCPHSQTRFHSIQRLGNLPPLELRQCLSCRTTLAAPLAPPRPQREAAIARSL